MMVVGSLLASELLTPAGTAFSAGLLSWVLLCATYRGGSARGLVCIAGGNLQSYCHLVILPHSGAPRHQKHGGLKCFGGKTIPLNSNGSVCLT